LISIEANSQCTTTITTFPYDEGFESGTSFWVSGGLNNDWAWGTPSKPTITGAGAGTKCWITGGLTASFYSLGERSWVESPCFDFTNLNRPYVSFLVFWETERRYDGGNFQYSLDLGTTWINVGGVNDPTNCYDQNWFNFSGITNLNSFVTNTQGWSGTVQTSSGSCNGGGGSGGWKLATHCMKTLANKPQVKFRFTFGSGTTCNDFDGLAFDDFHIGEAPAITDDFIYSCSGGRTINFRDQNPDCHNQWSWNFGDPTSPNNLANGDDVDHEFTSGGIFSVTFKTGGGCSVDTQIVKQVKIPEVSVQTTSVSCDGGSDGQAQVVVNNPGAGISYSWSQDNSLNSATAANLSATSYYVTITDPTSCTITVPVNINYGPNAFPEVYLGDDTAICLGSEFSLVPGLYSSYKWQDNSTDSFYIVKTNGIYSVEITNTSGCLASDTIYIREDCLQDIIVPNAFTPNGDGINEIFQVSGSEPAEFKIYIYDRWGEMIFSSDNRSLGWDGSVKGHPVQEGFYNYFVDYTIGRDERTKKGSIYLIR
jgi:gliding motility-associated-like protein